jgi:glycosyltransferase involved in cell wall biosynthesis
LAFGAARLLLYRTTHFSWKEHAMRIAQVAPLYESVPPEAYGGTQRVISYLTEELVRQGHQVTLLASGDSRTSAELIPVCRKALWRDGTVKDTLTHHVRQLEIVAASADQFDVVHYHGDPFHFPLARRLPCHHVTTLHGQLLPVDHGPLFKEFSDAPLVSISNDQRGPIPWANWRATVYHGLPPDELPFNDQPGDYLLFLGRIMREKRPDLAVEIARRAKIPLKVGAAVHPGEGDYFRDEIDPLFRSSSSFVDFLGEVGGQQRRELLAGARALVFPIEWPEPFGLAMIEAMACGTPVIAFRRGSVPEVIDDGASGAIVDGVEQAVEAVARVGTLDRRAVRECFERRFTAERMAREYVGIYERLMG